MTKWPGTPVSETAIPLGDGKVSSSPEVGYQDSCTLNFRGGGARSSLPWINTTNHTWNFETKIAVEGTNSWPDARHSFTLQGASRVLATNDLPEPSIPGGLKPGITGDFPISPSDPAYQYDTNPNQIAAQSLSWTVPASPTSAPAPSCTPLGPIGVFVNGVVMFNALDDAGRDAGAHEVQDSCDGHPQGQEVYHYHDFSACLATAANAAAGSSTLVGYALDGYGVFLERDAQGNLPTDADLDACHGRTSTVMWDGKSTSMYHYDVTLEYPYFVGCFYGTPAVSGRPGV
ncbi:MAG: YHYH protein [Acidimicrobiales bacterium]